MYSLMKQHFLVVLAYVQMVILIRPIRSDVSSESFSIPQDAILTSGISTESNVRHIAHDQYKPANILFIDSFSLKTSDGNSNEVVAGAALIHGYTEGVGPEARFTDMYGFVQLNQSQVVVVDKSNHCMRLIDRHSNRTSPYSGQCTTSGDRDGTDPLLNLPYSMICDVNDPLMLIFTDFGNVALKTLSMSTMIVSTLVKSDALSQPKGLTQDTSTGDLYITTYYYILRYDFILGTLSHISGVKKWGFLDGPLEQAKYFGPQDLLIIDEDKLIVSDFGNDRLRVLDLRTNTTWSICSGYLGVTDGTISSCQLFHPQALAVVDNTLYIGCLQGIRVIKGSLTIAPSTTSVGSSRHESPSNLTTSPSHHAAVNVTNLPSAMQMITSAFNLSENVTIKHSGYDSTPRNLSTGTIETEKITTIVAIASVVIVTVVSVLVFAAVLFYHRRRQPTANSLKMEETHELIPDTNDEMDKPSIEE